MTETDDKNEVVKKRSSFGKKVQKGLLILIIFFSIFSLSLVILSQFKFFRNFALQQILSYVNNSLIANIEADDLTFWNPEGIKIYGARLITDGDTLAYIPELILNINYESLFIQKIYVDRLILNKPDIRLLRNSKDSIWNYDKIALQSEDTTSSGLPPWIIKIKNLELNDAKFVYYDSTNSYINSSTMDYSHIKLDGFDLHLSGLAVLDKNDFAINIRKLRAYETYSELNIDFEGKLGINEKLIYLKDVNTKLNNSNFDIQAEMSNYNVFDTIREPEISEAKFKLAFKGYNINDDIIYKFAVIPINFGSSVNLKIDANGILNKMRVERLNLVTGNSDINMSGNLENVLDIDNFNYEFSLDESFFTRADIIATLSNIDLSSIPAFKSAKAERLYVKGFVDSVYSDMSLNTDIGSVVGKVGINFKHVDLKYFADLKVQSLNLEPILHQKSMKSNLNGRIYVKGSGSEIANLKTIVEAQLSASEIYDIKFEKLATNLSASDNEVLVKFLNIDFPKQKGNTDFLDNSLNDHNFSLDGALNLQNINNPEYDLNIELSSINLKELLKINSLPDLTTASMQINMKGIDLDSLEGSSAVQINELNFSDRAFLPFSLNTNFVRKGLTGREISLNADFFNIIVDGEFEFSNLITNITNQGEYLIDFIKGKVNSFNPANILRTDSTDAVLNDQTVYINPETNAQLHADISDLSPLNIFLDSLSIYSNIQLDCQIVSNDKFSNFYIDSLQVDYFDYKSSSLMLKTDALRFDGKFISSFSNSKPFLDNLIINLDTTAELSLNNIIFNNLYTFIDYDGESLKYKMGSKINTDLSISSFGNININGADLQLTADSLIVVYRNYFKWENELPIKINTTESSITVNQMNMFRKDGEKFTLNGTIDSDVAQSLNLQITNAPLSDFLVLADEETRKQYSGSNIFLDSLRIAISGDLKEPKIVASISADSVMLNNYKLGTISGKLIHNKTYVHGFFDITNQELENKKVLGIEVNYLPVYLGMNPGIPMLDDNKAMDIRLKALGLPMELLDPFSSKVGLKDLTGLMDATLIIEGNITKGIAYSGSATSQNARLRIDNTNVSYNAELDVDFNRDKITLTKVILRNVDEDSRFGRLGKANASGYIEMKGFEVGYMDITAQADRLLVMSDATMLPMPDLYGDFIISTDTRPLRFYGTLDKPNLDGDINIIYGHLKMPMETTRQTVRTYFTYQVIGDKVRLQSTSIKDSLNKTVNQNEENVNKVEGIKTSIADLINYNLSAKIYGQFIVEMDMNIIGSMYAVIGTPDRSMPLRYEKNREWSSGKLFGEVLVKEQSTIKSWKQFSTYGKINFPTGSIDNPSLDLIATHTGTMVENDQRKQFIVKMYITGYQENPIVKFTYYIDGVEASGPQEQINEDALYLLVMGRTKAGSGGGSTNSNLLNEGFASGVSNFATKALSDLLIGTGVINSAEFDFHGGSMNLGDATLRLSGQLYGGISWTIGGTVADLSSNNQITIDIPASEFSNNPFWSNFVLQLSKASSNNVMANSQDAKNWEVKIKLGSSW